MGSLEPRPERALLAARRKPDCGSKSGASPQAGTALATAAQVVNRGLAPGPTPRTAAESFTPAGIPANPTPTVPYSTFTAQGARAGLLILSAAPREAGARCPTSTSPSGSSTSASETKPATSRRSGNVAGGTPFPVPALRLAHSSSSPQLSNASRASSIPSAEHQYPE